MEPIKAVYLRNFVFGVEDSLVSTVGLLSGVAVAGTPRATIVLTGMVLIFVEAFSMGVGSFLSERSVEEYEAGPEALRTPLLGGSVMFLSYFLAGFIPLAPYLFPDAAYSFEYSIIASLVALFALGFASGKITKRGMWRRGLRVFLVGGLAILIGIAVGKFVA